ncbi:hypothetical protein SISNIDRAFT_158239 [Sistotremastrum niveocremeum HHB9708]|uniref:Uncharacterized protein n=1 Tax=Sistotremastrum niveocremeum HHB9708 TaxID=1314777 RepID=A0A164SQS9_9AGAM|nr:hypothetical protein SISNIDRAFT_158239 [Sistotremastrum niveocremeum HHB9708]
MRSVQMGVQAQSDKLTRANKSYRNIVRIATYIDWCYLLTTANTRKKKETEESVSRRVNGSQGMTGKSRRREGGETSKQIKYQSSRRRHIRRVSFKLHKRLGNGERDGKKRTKMTIGRVGNLLCLETNLESREQWNRLSASTRIRKIVMILVMARDEVAFGRMGGTDDRRRENYWYSRSCSRIRRGTS